MVRRDSSGADYFINSGNIRQRGIESHLAYTFLPKKSFLKKLATSLNYTFNHFIYGSFQKGTVDYSGKKVPSVPAHTISFNVDFLLKADWYCYLSYYQVSKIFLNDANTVFANPYHILTCKVGKQFSFNNKIKIDIFAGIDNILNETYSLGNDINTTGDRYFNAAPGINFMTGSSIGFGK